MSKKGRENCPFYTEGSALRGVPQKHKTPLTFSLERMKQPYRYLVRDEHCFIQLLATNYACRGYPFYFRSRVPDGKASKPVDEKLLAEYGIATSKQQRWRRKRLGRANLQYLRYQQDFVILATHGENDFFQKNEGAIRDMRSHPLKFYGYSVSLKGGHCVVRIEQEQYKLLKATFQETALLRKDPAEIGAQIDALPFERYRGVLKQLFSLVKATNEVRGPAGLPKVPNSVIRVKRRIFKPFVEAVPPTP